MQSLFDTLHQIILTQDATQKCASTQQLANDWASCAAVHDEPVVSIETPGYPPQLQMVAPKELKRRGIQSQQGRNILLHAVAHIRVLSRLDKHSL